MRTGFHVFDHAKMQTLAVQHKSGKISLNCRGFTDRFDAWSWPACRQDERLISVPDAYHAIAEILIGGAGDLGGQLRIQLLGARQTAELHGQGPVG
jgi:hypothetical protein